MFYVLCVDFPEAIPKIVSRFCTSSDNLYPVNRVFPYLLICFINLFQRTCILRYLFSGHCFLFAEACSKHLPFQTDKELIF